MMRVACSCVPAAELTRPPGMKPCARRHETPAPSGRIAFDRGQRPGNPALHIFYAVLVTLGVFFQQHVQRHLLRRECEIAVVRFMADAGVLEPYLTSIDLCYSSSGRLSYIVSRGLDRNQDPPAARAGTRRDGGGVGMQTIPSALPTSLFAKQSMRVRYPRARPTATMCPPARRPPDQDR